MPSITNYDIEDNEQELKVFMIQVIGDLPTTDHQKTIFAFLKNFMSANFIALNRNLLGDEQEALLKIIKEMLRIDTSRIPEFQDQLIRWKKSLKLAVSGQGEHVIISISAGMAADLLKDRKILANKEATDLDFLQYFGKEITSPEKICATQKKYILLPTESAFFETYLSEVKNAIVRERINGSVEINFPINNGNYHWQSAHMQFQCKGGVIKKIDGLLWDPLQGDDHLGEKKPEFSKFKSAIEKICSNNKIIFHYGDVQSDGSACGIYVAKQLHFSVGKSPAPQKTDNVNNLRLEFVKRIADNHPSLGSSTNLKISSSGEISIAPEQAVKAAAVPADHPLAILTKAGAKTLTSEEKKWQIHFDSIFANKLQTIYDNDHTIDDKRAEREARKSAMVELGFFASSEPTTVSAETVSSSHKIK